MGDTTEIRLTPDQALQLLSEGNQRFASGAPEHPRASGERRDALACGEPAPVATVIGCADSRAPLELLFDCGVGDLFAVRIAGNVCTPEVLASVEFGVLYQCTPLCVVLGHTQCLAVTSALAGARLAGTIPELLARIAPAAQRTRAAQPMEAPAQLAELAIRENIWLTIEGLLAGSAELRKQALIGKLRLEGALYRLEDGLVEWLGAHPREAVLLAG